MFGYVRVEKGELKVKEYEAYRGVYCSLCRALSRRYGICARLILSYDMTFLALVRFSKFGEGLSFRPGRCPFNPAKRCNYCTNGEAQFDFICAAAVLMFYYKVKDDLQDEGIWRRALMLLLLPIAALWRKKAKRAFPALDTLLSAAMTAQARVEANGTPSFDQASHASADALGCIFAFGSEDPDRWMYRFGYAVGRWVYLTDAADDLEKDLKRGRFNVFIRAFGLRSPTLTDKEKEEIQATLNASIGMAIDAFQRTGCVYYSSIIENVLYEGMAHATERFMKGDETDERSL